MKTIYFTVAMLLAFACCINAQTSSEHTIEYETLYTDTLVVEKDYYHIGVKGRVFTSFDLLSSQVCTQVTLTKVSERNATTFSLSKTDNKYVMYVIREKVRSNDKKQIITTSDCKEITKWIMETTMNGSPVYIFYNKESRKWYGCVIK